MMEAYLRAFVYFEQNDWARLLPMEEFTCNNAKNANIGHTPFKLNFGYYLYVLRSTSSSALCSRP